MRFLILSTSFFWILLFAAFSEAKTTQDLDLFNYEVRFTNPDCDEYSYTDTVLSQSGERLYKKPSSYCTPSDGRRASQNKKSPIRKVMEWINSPSTKDITLLTFSLSNSEFIDGICKAAGRGVPVNVVLDTGVEPAEVTALKSKLESCNRGRGIAINVIVRGRGPGLGIHHNKLLLINSEVDDEPLKLAYGSANFSSGLVLHHENWSFVEIQKESHFAQKHLCLKNGVIESGQSKSAFTASIKSCVAKIPFEVETDLILNIAPVEGPRATQLVEDAISKSASVDVAAHRFSNSDIISALKKLDAKKIRMIFDDDMFWAVKTGAKFGDQDANEARIVGGFVKSGASVRYLETEHRQHLLHHNKYLIFRNSRGQATAVHTGAGNLTGAAFRTNFENFYFISRPDIVAEFDAQYDRLFKEIATSAEDMPTEAEPNLRKN